MSVKCYLEDIKSSRYDQTVERLGEWSDTCIVCGKRTLKKSFLQLDTNGYLTDDESEVEDSQGMFCVGPDCLKKFYKHAKND